jgi:hypothetical protein
MKVAVYQIQWDLAMTLSYAQGSAGTILGNLGTA